jgi:hypothetical protein
VQPYFHSSLGQTQGTRDRRLREVVLVAQPQEPPLVGRELSQAALEVRAHERVADPIVLGRRLRALRLTLVAGLP